MADEAKKKAGRKIVVTEAEIDAALAEHGDDVRETVRALLHDIAAMADDSAAVISWGYVRGRGMKRAATKTNR